ncbi:hypothetical protein ACIPY3_21300 [Paenarthrobacter sp. NPDC089714]|uniref:hypothetical protein n=1 Tax=Paenarthrobacter sp. NPDC089714 TaxID=3364377 RepID=UPI003810F51E
MEAFVCVACGAQYPPSEQPPAACLGCQEERQFVPGSGQQWTTLEKAHHTRFTVLRQHEPRVIGVGTEPKFGIGQRAILLQTPHGNILWDLTPYIDETTVMMIKALGGVQMMAISHPHFYTTMVEWSKAFGDVPIYLHAADREYVRRESPAINYWEGDTHELVPGVTLIRAGGHFSGGTMLHWAEGAEGKGIVCSADMMYITPDNQYLTFMRSYPTFIPLSPAGAKAVVGTLDGFHYETIYGHFFDMKIESNAEEAVRKSLDRYVAAVDGRYDSESGNSAHPAL